MWLALHKVSDAQQPHIKDKFMNVYLNFNLTMIEDIQWKALHERNCLKSLKGLHVM